MLQLHPSRLTTGIKIACEIFGSHSSVDEGSSLRGSLDPEDEVMTHLRNVEDCLPISTALRPSQKTLISWRITLKSTEKQELLVKM